MFLKASLVVFVPLVQRWTRSVVEELELADISFANRVNVWYRDDEHLRLFLHRRLWRSLPRSNVSRMGKTLLWTGNETTSSNSSNYSPEFYTLHSYRWWICTWRKKFIFLTVWPVLYLWYTDPGDFEQTMFLKKSDGESMASICKWRRNENAQRHRTTFFVT
jgi:hypothetical protein